MVLAWPRDSQCTVPQPEAQPSGPRACLAPAPAEAQRPSARFAAEPPREAVARLTVHVVGHASQRPLENIALTLACEQPTTSSASSQGPSLQAVSDARGLAVFSPAITGCPLALLARWPDGHVAPLALRIPPLGPGAEEELDFDLPEPPDSRVFGLVVDVESQAPIRGAAIELHERWNGAEPLASTTSGNDGRFEIPCSSFPVSHLRVEAQGYGLRLADPRGHTDPARPLRVELAQAATLDVRVLDSAGAPRAGAHVRVEARARELGLVAGEGTGFLMSEIPPALEPAWEGRSDERGATRLAALPARADLLVRAWGDGATGAREPQRVRLEPGETRTLEIVLGGGTRIHGRLLDQQGQALADRELRLAAERDDPWSHSLWIDGAQIRQRVRSDAQGRFEFDSVQDGNWLVAASKGAGIEALAMRPERVRVAGEAQIALTLHAACGLALAGHVLDAQGAPVVDALVEAYVEGELYFDEGRSEQDGTFRIAPVTAEEFTLIARAPGFAMSAPVRARAGAATCEIRLEPGVGFRGRVIDAASGAGCHAQVLCTPEVRGFGPYGHGTLLETDAEGGFVLGGLEPGRYGFAALAADGRCALRAGVGAGGDAEVVLALEPGARLALHHRGARRAYVRVTRSGVPAHFGDVLEPGEHKTILAPAGELVLELRDDPLGEPRRMPVSVQAGATLALETRE